MVRAGIRAMLSMATASLRFDIEEAETSEEAIIKAALSPYDVILMDYHLPGRGGPKATEIIMKKTPSARILALSNYEERLYVERMMEAGAKGYALKNVEPDMLVSAIKTILTGKPFFSNEIALQLLNPIYVRPSPEVIDRLTEREREIFMKIVEGMTDKQIAAKLGIAKLTVDKHRQNLMRKLGAKNAAHLVQIGLKSKLI